MRLICVWAKVRVKEKSDENQDPLFNPIKTMPIIPLLPQLLIARFTHTNTLSLDNFLFFSVSNKISDAN